MFLLPGVVEDGLTIKFFGENKDKKLTIREFGSFHEALRMEVLQLEVQCILVHVLAFCTIRLHACTFTCVCVLCTV